MSTNTTICNSFNIFKELGDETVKNIKLFSIIYSDKLHFVTLDDNVYNYNSKNKQLMKIDELCNKQVIKFCSGFNLNGPGFVHSGYVNRPHYLALTDDGTVFGWGNNDFGQLGSATNHGMNKPAIIESLRDFFIIDACCGFVHSLVLTQDGGVLSFGYNRDGQCGTNSIENLLIPERVIFRTKVVGISCGLQHSAAVTESGEVFVWGSNRFNQLGIENFNGKHLIPTQLTLPSLIKQLMCGPCFILMLSVNGIIYFCGQIESNIKYNTPTKISNIVRFSDIAATINCQLCVALSFDNYCFIFGNYTNPVSGDISNSTVIKELKETDLSTIDETFAFYQQITYKSIFLVDIHKEKTIGSMNIVCKPNKYKKNYTELCTLGSGGFSTVYKAIDKMENKVYAIKKIGFDYSKAESVSNELSILSNLDSVFVVKYFDSWIESNTNDDEKSFPLILHIQMELCSFTLKDAIIKIKQNYLEDSGNALSFIGYYIASELLAEILECVQYLHQQNPAIIHRDIKPENILLTNFVNHRFAKLSDFGLSTLHEITDQSHTKYIGTVNYRATELSFTGRYTTKADIYSLGIVAQQLFNIDFNSDVSISSELVIKQKYALISKVTLSMVHAVPDLRPDCSKILSESGVWLLTNQELARNDEFNGFVSRIANINSIDENFCEYFVQNKFNFNATKLSEKKPNLLTKWFSGVFK